MYNCMDFLHGIHKVALKDTNPKNIKTLLWIPNNSVGPTYWSFDSLKSSILPASLTLDLIVSILPQSSWNGGFPSTQGQIAMAKQAAGTLSLSVWIRVPEYFGSYPLSNIGTLEGLTISDMQNSLSKWRAAIHAIDPDINVKGILTLQEQRYGPTSSGLTATSIAKAFYDNKDALGISDVGVIGTTIPGTSGSLTDALNGAFSIIELYEPYNNNHHVTFFGCNNTACACCTPDSLSAYGCSTCNASSNTRAGCTGSIYGKAIATAWENALNANMGRNVPCVGSGGSDCYMNYSDLVEMFNAFLENTVVSNMPTILAFYG